MTGLVSYSSLDILLIDKIWTDLKASPAYYELIRLPF